MRTFMICLLAVGAFAAESMQKASLNKHAKRGSLTGDHEFNVHNVEQFEQRLVRYTKPGYHQHVAQAGPVSKYASVLAYQAESTPLEHQQQTQPTGIYDNPLGQILLRQVGQGYDYSANFQEQQIGQRIYGHSDVVNTGSQSIGAKVKSHLVNVPLLSIPHQVPSTRTVQLSSPRQVSVEVSRSVEIPAPRSEPVSLTKAYRINVDRPVPVAVQQPLEVVQYPVTVLSSVSHPGPIQVSHREPLNIASGYRVNVGNNRNILIDDDVSYGQQSLGGLGHKFYNDAANLEGQELYANAGSLEDLESVNVESQQYDFGSQANYKGGSGLENVFPNVYKTVTYQRQVEQPAELITSFSDNHNSGYHYDNPENKFNI